MQLLRYSYVLVAGLFLGLLIHEVGFKGPKKLDFSEFYGTMSAARTAPVSRLIDQVDFSGTALTGSVISRRVESVNLIELDLDSEEPIQVAVNYGGGGVEMIGFAQDGGTPVAVKAEGGRVEIGPTTAGPLTLFLAVSNEESWADVEILVDEVRVHGGRLKLSGSESKNN